MGKLIYDGVEVAVIDDRGLAHLQIAIGAKLRRQESFYLSWANDVAQGSGRTVIWIDSHLSLRYLFSGNKVPTLNREWLKQLTETANSAMGMQLLVEPHQV